MTDIERENEAIWRLYTTVWYCDVISSEKHSTGG